MAFWRKKNSDAKKTSEKNITKHGMAAKILAFLLVVLLVSSPSLMRTEASEQNETSEQKVLTKVMSDPLMAGIRLLTGDTGAAAVYKDDEFLFAVGTKAEAEAVLSRYESSFYGNDPTITDTVSVATVVTRQEAILSEDEAYTVLKEENLLNVETTLLSEQEQVIPCAVTEIADDTLYQDSRKVVTQGVDGLRYDMVETVYVNGKTKNQRVTAVRYETIPQAEVVRVGTKARPNDVGTGTFIKPTTGNFESGFKFRWGRWHKGIDISNAVETPIYAADNGRVIYAGVMDGYGNLIQIDHQNGYVTYYAHLNSISVSVGDTVAQGDYIAGMGNTGNVTGTHLHFEVRVGGEAVDPLQFVSY